MKASVKARIDAEARAFEEELLRSPRLRAWDEAPARVGLNLPQSTQWLEHATRAFRLVQLSDAQGRPAAQAAATLYKPRGLGVFAHAEVPCFGAAAVSPEAELELLRRLPELLAESDGIASLRVQAYRPEYPDLADFTTIARRAGYRLTEPTCVTRTVVYDVSRPAEELLAALSSKTRAKVRHHSQALLEIRELDDPRWIPAMHAALNASFARTGGGATYPDFGTYFGVARARPDRVLILGLFLKSRPDQLLAFSIDRRHGDLVEATSSGSLPDAELRKTPFNYFLLWRKLEWAKRHGATHIDLGGITDGGESDPLAGISAFKRFFAREEREIGREMVRVVSPARHALYEALRLGTDRARGFYLRARSAVPRKSPNSV